MNWDTVVDLSDDSNVKFYFTPKNVILYLWPHAEQVSVIVFFIERSDLPNCPKAA
jgi:hypothetical protein